MNMIRGDSNKITKDKNMIRQTRIELEKKWI